MKLSPGDLAAVSIQSVNLWDTDRFGKEEVAVLRQDELAFIVSLAEDPYVFVVCHDQVGFINQNGLRKVKL